MSHPPSSPPSTKFPSIEKLRHLISNLQNSLGDDHHVSPPIPLLGTTKLHGTHVDVIISPDSSIRLQSRNLPSLTPYSDVHGFAAWMTDKSPVILRLRDAYHTRFQLLSQSVTLSPESPLILACEFIGRGIQKDVAISQLRPRLVILTAQLNGEWLPQEAYGDIAAEEECIYHVLRGGSWRVELDLADPVNIEKEIEVLVKAVEKRCPFGATFNVNGPGEGIVWAVSDTERFNGPKFWCKTKGGKFATSHTKNVPKRLSGNEKVVAFAEAVMTPPRLEQGWAYLEEVGVSKDLTNIGIFVEWLVADCLREERDEMKEKGADESQLKGAISRKGAAWYRNRLKEG